MQKQLYYRSVIDSHLMIFCPLLMLFLLRAYNHVFPPLRHLSFASQAASDLGTFPTAAVTHKFRSRRYSKRLGGY